MKKLPHSEATGQPLLERLGNKTRTRDRFFPILLHQSLCKKSQTQVLGNVKVTKFDKFWGQGSQIVWTPEG